MHFDHNVGYSTTNWEIYRQAAFNQKLYIFKHSTWDADVLLNTVIKYGNIASKKHS